MKRLTLLAILVTCLVPAIGLTGVVGYWRMESDTNTGTGYSVPNEVAGGSALTGSAGSVAPIAPVHPVPLTGAGNLNGLNGSANINGTAAAYAALDVESITVEAFARSTEGGGDLVSRTDGSSAGFRITNFSSLDVTYYVDDGLGGSQAVVLNTSHDMDIDWDHLAWTYDKASGIGRLFADGAQVAQSAATPGKALVWTGAGNLKVGTDMDGGPGISTTDDAFVDELRITSMALRPSSFLIASPTAGYWRMETDNNPSTNGLSVPNEVAGASPLISTSAGIAPPPAIAVVPATGSPNTLSLDGKPDINASVASYPELDLDSISVEFWARSNEGDADLVSRLGPATGFIITNPGSLDVTYYVDDGAGGTTHVTLNSSHSLSGLDWDHCAWTYDAATGVGNLYVNSTLLATHDGPDDRALAWTSYRPLYVGPRMDGSSISSTSNTGILDELRVSGVALPVGKFLNSPNSLRVDFGAGAHDVQDGFDSFSRGTGDIGIDGPTSETFLTALGINGDVTVTVDAEDTSHTIDFRDRGNAAGILGDLIEDHIKHQTGGVVLTLEGLEPGGYFMTSWHHDASAANALIDILVSDAHGTGLLLIDNLQSTGGFAPATVASATFSIWSDGVNPITILFDDDPNYSDHETPLNGFQLVAVPEPCSMALLATGCVALVARRRKRTTRRA